MNSQPEGRIRENGDFNSSNSSLYGDVVDTTLNINIEAEDKKRADLVEWLNGILPDLRLPLESSEEDIRACLIDGAVLCCITNRLSPRPVNEGSSYGLSSEVYMDNVKRFLAAMDELGLPKFELSDLEQGSMTTVLECLWTLKQQFGSSLGGDNNLVSISKPGSQQRKKWRVSENEHLEGNTGSQGDATSSGQHTTLSVEERQKNLSDYQSKNYSSDSKFQHVLHSPVMSESSAALIHHVGHKFHEVFQLKQGCYADLPPAKISEMLKSTSLDNAPTQSLLSVVNGILDESIERKNGEIPHRVACLLRKVVQEIERRISTQAEHLRTQNNLYKAREEKYKSRIRVLEALAAGTNEKTKIVNELQQTKTEKTKMEERMKHEQDVLRLPKEKDLTDREISSLKQELVMAKRTYEERCLQLESEAKGTKHDLEERLKELEFLLKTSQEEVKEFEAFSSSKAENWKKKECSYLSFIKSQFEALQELRVASESIKQEVISTQQTYLEEFSHLGKKLKGLAETVENYHVVLAENRRLYNDVQDLKGNIRVYCRIRPFLPGQNGRQTTIEYIGDNGELAVVNPSKQGKDSCRMFKFNKVFGPTATQAEVFLDTQPLIRSILDGYNVCIFAYGQTGSGKTYTMTGPDAARKEDWGVNYRALNDLFEISQSRKSSVSYEVGVQMVEIYNEQVRDLLSSDGSQKRLGVWTSAQPNGLAVPDASMHPVKSTTDVLDLMQIGLTNRAVSSTAMNQRSSRSHSVLTVHVRGMDLASGDSLRGSLHLVDLAGSERVDRSEVTGERLKEAQHINKSLSALGDVIFALAQKSPHVPYRNSKLTQVLQSSLGGQAKTLMFVQLNPDLNSYSETLSTLKFAERVSGVELGAARSSKEGKDVRELIEQVASLKDTIAKKDEEIEQLQLLKDLRTMSPSVNCEKQDTSLLWRGSSLPSKHSLSATPSQSQRQSGEKGSKHDKATSDQDKCSENNDKHSDASSQQSLDDFRHHKELFCQSKLAAGDSGQNFSADVELLGFGNPDSERSSDISDSGLSMGTETDGSICSVVEFSPFSEGSKPPESPDSSKPPESPEGSKPAESTEKDKAPSKMLRPSLQKQRQAKMVRPSSSKDLSKLSAIIQKQGQEKMVRPSSSKDLSKLSPTSRKTSSSSSLTKPPKRGQ